MPIEKKRSPQGVTSHNTPVCAAVRHWELGACARSGQAPTIPACDTTKITIASAQRWDAFINGLITSAPCSAARPRPVRGLSEERHEYLEVNPLLCAGEDLLGFKPVADVAEQVMVGTDDPGEKESLLT